MKIRKSSLLIIGICVLLLLSMTVSAETDASGDVLHWKGTDWHNWDWNVADRSNIDITDVSYLIGDRLTISMSVAGSLNTGLSLYHIEFNSADCDYRVIYTPEPGIDPIVTAIPKDFTIDDYATWEQPAYETSIQGGTLTATIDWATDDHTMTDYFGWAQEWITQEESALEAWWDYAPDDNSPFGSYDDYYGNSGNSGGSGTPGFETLAVIAAIGIALIILKRRK